MSARRNVNEGNATVDRSSDSAYTASLWRDGTMAMKHPGKYHEKAANKRRAKQRLLKAEKRALRQRLAEARKAQG
jgi:hypothetical protein